MNLRRSIQVLARKTPRPLRRFVKRAFVPEPFILWLYPDLRRAASKAKSLEAKLWGGFSRYALKDLEALKLSRRANPTDVSYAAWALARWYAVERQYERAYENVVLMRLADPVTRTDMGQALLEAECLIRFGDREAARTLLDEMMQLRPGDPNLCLAMANTYAPLEGPGDAENDAIRLAWINRVYETANLMPITKADSARPLALDNLTGARAGAPAPKGGEPKVTVIMPVYNSEATLPFALRGLLDQSWQNLEIIVVDDCSPDDSFAIAEEFGRRDARVRPVRQEKNQGAYVARNRGLALATGDFIATHDADDWSHPQRIEMQVADLSNDSSMGNFSSWVRTQGNLRFSISYRPWATIIHASHGSLLFRRGALVRGKRWDEVRVGADTEFVWRLQKHWGSAFVRWLPMSLPLAFALADESTLTGNRVTHLRTIGHGARREYREAARHWHRTTAGDELDIAPRSRSRSFPAPLSLLPVVADSVDCDLLFIMDFNLKGGAFVSTMQYVQAAIAQNRSVSLLHWRRYNLDVARPLKAEIRQMAQDRKLLIIAPGETVRASTVIVGNPAILQHVIDLCPRVEFESLVVIVNQMAARLTGGEDVQYNPLQVRENLKVLFGTEGIWAPISERVRRLMREDERYPLPHADTWTPLINSAVWCAVPVRWRGRECKRPTVGRHGRDHYSKWPASPEALRAAYCVDKNCDVVIMGGANCALDTIGAKPGNWTVHEFGAMEARVFLSGLDFFIHYPREDQIEAFGRAPMEAMAVGVPVILPPVFRETFGDAAFYAEPEHVWGVIEGLWKDESAYLARAQAGRDFVLQNCAFDRFPDRLNRLKGSVAAPVATSVSLV